jgi:hypothetical protein
MFLNVFSQETNLSIAEKSLGNGNIKKLSTIFYKSVDITFSNIAKTYSKAQAEMIIKKFFSKHDPKSFKIKQKGKSSSNSTLYAIGKLVTSIGTYQVYMFFVPSKDTYLLRELRFEKDE